MGWFKNLFRQGRGRQITDEEREESNKVRLLKNEVKFLNELLEKRNAEMRSLYSEKQDANMWGAINKFVDKIGTTDERTPEQKADNRVKAIAKIEQRIKEMDSEEIQSFVGDNAKLQKMISYAKFNGLTDEDINNLKGLAIAKFQGEPQEIEA